MSKIRKGLVPPELLEIMKEEGIEISNKDQTEMPELVVPEDFGTSENPITEEQFLQQRKSSGVLTVDEVEKAGGQVPPIINEPDDVIKEKEPEKKKEDIECEFECTFAQLGNSNVAFDHKFEGKVYHYQLSLKDKIFILPKDLSKDDQKRYRAALKDNGFVDVTVIRSGATVDPESKKLIYHVMHPEHNRKNRINGSIALVMVDDNNKPMYYKTGAKKGQQMVEQVNIIEGKVSTEKKQIYEALLRYGFYAAGKDEIEED